jgi:hypothetical protein
VRAVKADKSGIVEVRRFVERARIDSFVRLPKKEGIGPTRVFPPKLRYVIFVKDWNVAGMDPVREFQSKASEERRSKEPREEGIGPRK